MASARRVYVGLTALHWLAVGLVLPVLVLTLSARGLSVAVIGVLYTVNSVLTGALELPTGGLADSYGRRRVLIWSTSLTALAMLALGLGARLPVLLAGLVLLATGRALSSGPLEAWFVDASLAQDRDADLTPGLGAGTRAMGLGLGLGTLIGGFLPTLANGLPASGDSLLLSTSLPFVAAAALFVIEIVALWMFVRPLHTATSETSTSVRASILAGFAAWGDSTVTRRVLISYVAAGLSATAFEILVPLRLAELTGSPSAAAAFYGPLTAVGFTGGALFAGLSGRVRDRAGTPARAAIWLTVAAGAGGLLAGLPTVAAVAAGFLAMYVLTGPCPPLLNTLLHAEIGSDARTVLLSMVSMVSFVGAAVGGVAVPYAAALLGNGAGLAIGASALGLGAIPLIGLRPERA